MIGKLWEKIDGKVGVLAGIVITLAVLAAAIKFAAWAGPIIEDTRILRWIFGWLF